MLLEENKELLKTCTNCQETHDTYKQQTGLIINNEHLICKDCCTKNDTEELKKSIQQLAGEGRINARTVMTWLWEIERKKTE